MGENKEIIDKENTIQQEKDIEEQNNTNINNTINFMSYHIDGDKAKEYLNFIKKVRKLKKKINKNKEKLQEFDKIEKAYLEKNGKINNFFRNMAIRYEKRLKYDTVTQQKAYKGKYSLFQINNIRYLAERIDTANLYYTYVETLDIDSEYAFTLSEEGKLPSPLDIKFMIQNHYNNINTRIMIDVLNYYEEELEYWKSHLKEIEIENIKEFE